MTEVTTKFNPAAARPARPAVGPRLRILLLVVFALVALLGANSVYLFSVTMLEWYSREFGSGLTYQNLFYLVMFMLHLALGILLLGPFVVFGVIHMLATRQRRNRRAVRIGYVLFAIGLLVLLSGLALIRIPGTLELKNPFARNVVYWAHVVTPLMAVWLYCLHRLAGRRIKWRVGVGYATAVAAVVVLMVFLQAQDPRDWYSQAPPEGEQYFEPSLTRTSNGKWISAESLMNDQYCLKCHEDAYKGWFHSVHHFSSFNNPAYLASIRETREVLMERDGNVKASRWCAGCHDPVPFLSGAFDDPDYDMVNHPTAQAGITCTACHAITHVNSTKGNGDYVIEEPLHYPFAYSDNSVLQFINNTLVKAKPSFHKQTFLKPFHKTAEFCSACHKVHLPKALTNYKEFLRGQNHYDNFLLSGVSGGGIRSFYYPEKAQPNCNECHMPRVESTDFGARLYADSDKPQIHDHTFVGANTGVTWWLNLDQALAAHQELLKDCMRVDLFGIRENGSIDGQLHAPLRPTVPTLEPGKSYLLEAVIRTTKLGHLFTQGTVDSNEVWLEVELRSGGRVIGRSGALDPEREVDRWAHYVNVFMLDRNGDRVSRRNAQDIFVPLYNHQIPPGAGQTVHYGFRVPEDVREPIEISLKLNYRKFDKVYTDFMARSHKPGDLPLRGYEPGKPYENQLPITVMAEDRVVLPVAGSEATVDNPPSSIPTWQRWNDYGIGLLLKGKAELRQAGEAFAQVEQLGRYDGPLNLARAYYSEGRLDEAVDAIERAKSFSDPPPPPWTLAWLSGLVNREQGRLDPAINNFQTALEWRDADTVRRGFDFSRDYEVINELGATLFARSQQEIGPERKLDREAYLRMAAREFEKTLTIDEENVAAHYNLQLVYAQLGETEKAEHHRQLHLKYKPDENARDAAVQAARRKYPWGNHAAEAVVIYPLQRSEAPGLPGSDSLDPAAPTAAPTGE